MIMPRAVQDRMRPNCTFVKRMGLSLCSSLLNIILAGKPPPKSRPLTARICNRVVVILRRYYQMQLFIGGYFERTANSASVPRVARINVGERCRRVSTPRPLKPHGDKVFIERR